MLAGFVVGLLLAVFVVVPTVQAVATTGNHHHSNAHVHQHGQKQKQHDVGTLAELASAFEERVALRRTQTASQHAAHGTKGEHAQALEDHVALRLNMPVDGPTSNGVSNISVASTSQDATTTTQNTNTNTQAQTQPQTQSQIDMDLEDEAEQQQRFEKIKQFRLASLSQKQSRDLERQKETTPFVPEFAVNHLRDKRPQLVKFIHNVCKASVDTIFNVKDTDKAVAELKAELHISSEATVEVKVLPKNERNRHARIIVIEDWSSPLEIFAPVLPPFGFDAFNSRLVVERLYILMYPSVAEHSLADCFTTDFELDEWWLDIAQTPGQFSVKPEDGFVLPQGGLEDFKFHICVPRLCKQDGVDCPSLSDDLIPPRPVAFMQGCANYKATFNGRIFLSGISRDIAVVLSGSKENDNPWIVNTQSVHGIMTNMNDAAVGRIAWNEVKNERRLSRIDVAEAIFALSGHRATISVAGVLADFGFSFVRTLDGYSARVALELVDAEFLGLDVVEMNLITVINIKPEGARVTRTFSSVLHEDSTVRVLLGESAEAIAKLRLHSGDLMFSFSEVAFPESVIKGIRLPIPVANTLRGVTKAESLVCRTPFIDVRAGDSFYVEGQQHTERCVTEDGVVDSCCRIKLELNKQAGGLLQTRLSRLNILKWPPRQWSHIEPNHAFETTEEIVVSTSETGTRLDFGFSAFINDRGDANGNLKFFELEKIELYGHADKQSYTFQGVGTIAIGNTLPETTRANVLTAACWTLGTRADSQARWDKSFSTMQDPKLAETGVLTFTYADSTSPLSKRAQFVHPPCRNVPSVGNLEGLDATEGLFRNKPSFSIYNNEAVQLISLNSLQVVITSEVIEARAFGWLTVQYGSSLALNEREGTFFEQYPPDPKIKRPGLFGSDTPVEFVMFTPSDMFVHAVDIYQPEIVGSPAPDHAQLKLQVPAFLMAVQAPYIVTSWQGRVVDFSGLTISLDYTERHISETKLEEEQSLLEGLRIAKDYVLPKPGHHSPADVSFAATKHAVVPTQLHVSSGPFVILDILPKTELTLLPYHMPTPRVTPVLSLGRGAVQIRKISLTPGDTKWDMYVVFDTLFPEWINHPFSDCRRSHAFDVLRACDGCTDLALGTAGALTRVRRSALPTTLHVSSKGGLDLTVHRQVDGSASGLLWAGTIEEVVSETSVRVAGGVNAEASSMKISLERVGCDREPRNFDPTTVCGVGVGYMTVQMTPVNVGLPLLVAEWKLTFEGSIAQLNHSIELATFESKHGRTVAPVSLERWLTGEDIPALPSATEQRSSKGRHSNKRQHRDGAALLAAALEPTAFLELWASGQNNHRAHAAYPVMQILGKQVLPGLGLLPAEEEDDDGAKRRDQGLDLEEEDAAGGSKEDNPEPVCLLTIPTAGARWALKDLGAATWSQRIPAYLRQKEGENEVNAFLINGFVSNKNFANLHEGKKAEDVINLLECIKKAKPSLLPPAWRNALATGWAEGTPTIRIVADLAATFLLNFRTETPESRGFRGVLPVPGGMLSWDINNVGVGAFEYGRALLLDISATLEFIKVDLGEFVLSVFPDKINPPQERRLVRNSLTLKNLQVIVLPATGRNGELPCGDDAQLKAAGTVARWGKVVPVFCDECALDLQHWSGLEVHAHFHHPRPRPKGADTDPQALADQLRYERHVYDHLVRVLEDGREANEDVLHELLMPTTKPLFVDLPPQGITNVFLRMPEVLGGYRIGYDKAELKPFLTKGASGGQVSAFAQLLKKMATRALEQPKQLALNTADVIKTLDPAMRVSDACFRYGPWFVMSAVAITTTELEMHSMVQRKGCERWGDAAARWDAAGMLCTTIPEALEQCGAQLKPDTILETIPELQVKGICNPKIVYAPKSPEAAKTPYWATSLGLASTPDDLSEKAQESWMPQTSRRCPRTLSKTGANTCSVKQDALQAVPLALDVTPENQHSPQAADAQVETCLEPFSGVAGKLAMLELGEEEEEEDDDEEDLANLGGNVVTTNRLDKIAKTRQQQKEDLKEEMRAIRSSDWADAIAAADKAKKDAANNAAKSKISMDESLHLPDCPDDRGLQVFTSNSIVEFQSIVQIEFATVTSFDLDTMILGTAPSGRTMTHAGFMASCKTPTEETKTNLLGAESCEGYPLVIAKILSEIVVQSGEATFSDGVWSLGQLLVVTGTLWLNVKGLERYFACEITESETAALTALCQINIVPGNETPQDKELFDSSWPDEIKPRNEVAPELDCAKAVKLSFLLTLTSVAKTPKEDPTTRIKAFKTCKIECRAFLTTVKTWLTASEEASEMITPYLQNESCTTKELAIELKVAEEGGIPLSDMLWTENKQNKHPQFAISFDPDVTVDFDMDSTKSLKSSLDALMEALAG